MGLNLMAGMGKEGVWGEKVGKERWLERRGAGEKRVGLSLMGVWGEGGCVKERWWGETGV